ncbi:hypothetical protein ACJ72_01971 [Emergomyces africanus]|uniref:C3H1-type domain-containing protein n=1 Tax=Emergomyces africanus TaxID=1955775 RepID=A0A1B7P3T9_9EURO|nr:hypothetical protein ACJ72_01971 [Emergomyces africanus]
MQPEFCITRPNGVVTALIAVDELPPFVGIRGVPRFFGQIDDAHGMTNVGTAHSRGQFYTIDVAVDANTHPFNMGFTNGISNEETTMAHESAITIGGNGILRRSGFVDAAIWNPNSEEHNIVAWRKGVNENAATNTGQKVAKLDDSSPTQRRESGSQNANYPKPPPKKEYCSFWIRRGECDYSQQGCLFKHEMPTDPETLGRLGLRDIPRWYREKYKVKSIVGLDGMGIRAANVTCGGWKHIGPIPLASFPVSNYRLPPTRFNVGVAEGGSANGLPHYIPAGTIFAPNGAQFGRDVEAKMIPASISSSLSEGNNRAISMATENTLWKDSDFFSHAQNRLSGIPVPSVDCNHTMNAIGCSTANEPVGCCSSTSAVDTGAPSMTCVKATATVTNHNDIDRSSTVHAHSRTTASRSNASWPMTYCNHDEMSSSLLSPFQSMTVAEPRVPMTPERLTNNKLKPRPPGPQTTHVSSSTSPFPTNDALRNAATPSTNSNLELFSSLSSPIPSPTRTQPFLSSHSGWTLEPTHTTAAPSPLENPSSTGTPHLGDSTYFGSPNPSLKPIGFNQNGENWRQRRMKQIAENDPFGLGLKNDARHPSSGRS